MLNKPNFFGKRNEAPAPLPTRDTSPATPAGQPPLGSPGRTPASGPATASAPTEAAKSPVKPAASIEAISGNRLIIGPDVKLKGAEILDCDTLAVEGRVEATMDSRVMHIAEKGLFSGKVGVDIAEVHGTFEGELTVRQQLVIHATGRVIGKIRYGKILIAAGGELSGDVQSLDAASAVPVLTAPAASTTPATPDKHSAAA